jgi:uncharacterized protein
MGDARKLARLIKGGKVYVWQGTYAIVRAARPCRGAAVVIRDKTETTCVIEESLWRPENHYASDPGWKIITFDMILPFGLVGFMAAVSGALAKAGIGICALSAYSTDHVMVKSRDLEKALAALKKLGFLVDENPR